MSESGLEKSLRGLTHCRSLLVASILLLLAIQGCAREPVFTFRGTVSDRLCGDNVDTDRIKRCFEYGVEPVLVLDSGEVVGLARAARLKKYPARYVEVTGIRRRNTITVQRFTVRSAP